MSVPLSAPVFFPLRLSKEVLLSSGAPVPESEAFIQNMITLKVSESYFMYVKYYLHLNVLPNVCVYPTGVRKN